MNHAKQANLRMTKRLLCAVGLHHWQGCRCARCSARRDKLHEWNACECIRCGKIKSAHNWVFVQRYNSRGGEHNAYDLYKCTFCGKEHHHLAVSFSRFGDICEHALKLP